MEAIEKAIDVAEARNERREANNPEIRKAIAIVHDFIQTEDVICYGGTAINNLLPKEDQFYDTSRTIPDYDMFSETPQVHALMLADLLDEAGIVNVEVKPGVHMGTFKVFANYMGVADITYMEEDLFDTLWKDSITKDKIHYAPPNFLRMSMFLELSRPRGDVSRWSKVYKRLQLLNEAYPIQCPKQEGTTEYLKNPVALEDFLIDHNVVLLGLHASQIHEKKADTWDIPIDLLVRSEDRPAVLKDLKAVLGDVTVTEHLTPGEFVPPHVDLHRGKHLLARLFQTDSCHSYHETSAGYKIASIPTILHFFLAFLYSDSKAQKELDENRILCVAQRLIDLASGERHKRRFAFLVPLDCLGMQSTLGDVRLEKAKLYDQIIKEKGKESPEFMKYFFTYSPTHLTKTQRNTVRALIKKTQRNKRTSRS